jgi:hypothetical protein
MELLSLIDRNVTSKAFIYYSRPIVKSTSGGRRHENLRVGIASQ